MGRQRAKNTTDKTRKNRLPTIDRKKLTDIIDICFLKEEIKEVTTLKITIES